MQSRRVLVTGANGFIGRHLCLKLIASGREVVACVRHGADISSLSDLEGKLQIRRIVAPVEKDGLTEALKSVDAVIHLAGRAHVMNETVADPLQEFRNANVRGTEILARSACEAGVRRFIFVSSIKVNGEQTDGVAFRADDPQDFRDPYGQSKWEAEESLRGIADGHGMEWVIVRPPLVYGPAVRGNFLSLLKWVSRGVPLPVGGIYNQRSIVSVYNLSCFLSLVIDHPSASGNRFLVADQIDVSTADLVRKIARSLNRPARIIKFPKSILLIAGAMLGRAQAIQRFSSSLVVDREKVTSLLGWTAPMPLQEALEHTANWFLKRPQATDGV